MRKGPRPGWQVLTLDVDPIVDVLQLRDPGCEYLAEKGQLRVQVEWEESHMLFQATYHKYDDVSRVHNIQMR